MSIFVLNLATLLGLGLGVDYSLLMTSRFREELRRAAAARDPTDAGPSRRAVDGGGRPRGDRRAGRLLLRPDRPARPARPGPVRVHDPALGRDRRARSSSASRSLRRADPAAGDPVRSLGPPPRRLAVRRVNAGATSPSEPVGAPRPAGDAPARSPSSSRPSASCSSSGRRSCTSGSTPRTRRSCPTTVPSRAAFDRLDDAFGAGRFAPLALAIRTTGPATSPANVAALLRLLAAARRRSRGSRAVDGLVDVDPRLSLAASTSSCYGAAGRPARPLRRRPPWPRRRRAT